MWYIKSTLNIYINVRAEFPAFPLQLSEKYTQIFQNRAHSARMIFVVCVCVSLFHITGFVWSFPELPNVAIFFFPGRSQYLGGLLHDNIPEFGT